MSKSGTRLLASVIWGAQYWIVTFDISQGLLNFIGTIPAGAQFYSSFDFPISYLYCSYIFVNGLLILLAGLMVILVYKCSKKLNNPLHLLTLVPAKRLTCSPTYHFGTSTRKKISSFSQRTFQITYNSLLCLGAQYVFFQYYNTGKININFLLLEQRRLSYYGVRYRTYLGSVCCCIH